MSEGLQHGGSDLSGQVAQLDLNSSSSQKKSSGRYIPPHLRRAGSQQSQPRSNSGDGGRGGPRPQSGSSRPQGQGQQQQRSKPPLKQNTRWQQDSQGSRGPRGSGGYQGQGNGYNGGYDRRGGYDQQQQRGGYSGFQGRSGGYQNQGGYGGRDRRGGRRFEDDGDWTTPLPRDERLEAQLFSSRPSGINFDKYDDIPVETSGSGEIPAGIEHFMDANLGEIMKNNLELANYSKPTPVQKNSIPIVTSRRDLMACAQTGSGKTAAFLVPILSRVLETGPVAIPADVRYKRGAQFPVCLVIAPTRELVQQIYKEAQKFAYRSKVRICAVYGGAKAYDQIRDLERGCQVIVATPGRLTDLIERGNVRLDNIRFLVLDEADRMLDMGFEPQIRRIVEESYMPPAGVRQTLMFSATFPREIQFLAQDFLDDYVFLKVGVVGSTSENITQHVQWVEEHEKRDTLLDYLHAAGDMNLCLVFVETKRAADALEDFLYREKFPASSIHGDKTQGEREFALDCFKKGKTPILVATAVAARGLDIPNVMRVINFDLPSDIDEYVHRIGRTGRAGHTGEAISFFNRKNMNVASQLLTILNDANQTVPTWLPQLARGGPSGRRGQSRDYRRSHSGGGRQSSQSRQSNGGRQHQHQQSRASSAQSARPTYSDQSDWWN
jgi:superfamily II DNA/RNA helicase